MTSQEIEEQSFARVESYWIFVSNLMIAKIRLGAIVRPTLDGIQMALQPKLCLRVLPGLAYTACLSQHAVPISNSEQPEI